MGGRRTTKYILLLCALLLAVAVGGVFALWQYAGGPVLPVDEALKLNVFPWTGSEILPEDSKIGENHRRLIDTIINGDGIGLNSANSYLNKQIQKRLDGGWFVPSRDTLGSVAVTQGDELNELFDLNTTNIIFLIHMVSDTEYHLYTTSVALGERGSVNAWGNNNKAGSPNVPLGEYIYPIYRTVVLKTAGAWAAEETAIGAAKSAWYEESRSNANATQIPSFDPDSWVEGHRGQQVSEAIWTFVGDDPTAYPQTIYDNVYYRLDTAADGSRNVLSYEAGCSIAIYNAANVQIAAGQPGVTADGRSYVQAAWSGTAGETYYIVISGALHIPFTVN